MAFKETREVRNHNREHAFGIEYIGPLGRYWLGSGYVQTTAQDFDERIVPIIRPQLMSAMDAITAYRRKQGIWSYEKGMAAMKQLSEPNLSCPK